LNNNISVKIKIVNKNIIIFEGGCYMATIDSQNIIGIKEIANIFNVSSSAVVNFQKRYPDFPAPVKELESGPIFD